MFLIVTLCSVSLFAQNNPQNAFPGGAQFLQENQNFLDGRTILPNKKVPRSMQKDKIMPDSVIVVFKEKAVTLSKKGGKSKLDQTVFKYSKKPERMFKAVRKSKKTMDGKELLTRAGRNLKNMYKTSPKDGHTVEETLAEFHASPLVEYAEPDSPVELLAMPNDTWFEQEQWSLYNIGQTFHTTLLEPMTGTPGADINWLPAWESGLLPTNEVLIGVVDSGVDYTHADMVNQMWINPDEIPGNGIDDDMNGYIDDVFGYDIVNMDSDPMDGLYHGTHVAGIIAAEVNNAYGMAGVCPNAKIIAAKIFKDNGSGGTASVGAEGIKYCADQGAKVINNSWGGTVYSQFMQDTITYANELGAVVLAAAGNRNYGLLYFPAAYYGVLSVAASDADDNRAWFSNYGRHIDVSAPGVYIFSLKTALLSGAYGVFSNDFLIISGTSMACPTAAGLAGLLVSKFPGFEPWVYEQVMERTCSKDFYTIGENSNYVDRLGAGRIRVQEALSFTNAAVFLTSRFNLTGRSFLAPGESANMLISLGAWTEDMANLTVHVTAITPGITVSASSYFVGDIVANSSIDIPDDAFYVTVKNKTEWNTIQQVRVEVKNGTEVYDVRTNSLQIFDGNIRAPISYDLDGDGESEIIGNSGSSIIVFDTAGQLKWFYDLGAHGLNGIQGRVSVGDIDADGFGEVVVQGYFTFTGMGVNNRAICVLEHDGTMNSSFWPKNVWTNMFDSYSISTRYPCQLADMDGDGDLDIVTTGGNYNNHAVYLILDEEGVQLGHHVSTRYGYMPSLLAVGDLEGNGTNVIVSIEQRLAVKRSYVTVLDQNANELNSFMIRSRSHEDGYFGGSTLAGPTLADIDLDGRAEILAVGAFYDENGNLQPSKLVAWESDGTILDGFPVQTDQRTHVPTPVVLDADGDGDLEIFVVGNRSYQIYGYDHLGNSLPFFPITDLNVPNVSQYVNGYYLVMGNLDEDEDAELLYIGNYENDGSGTPYTYTLWARDIRDGLLVPGFPIELSGVDADQFPQFSCAIDSLGSSEFGTNVSVISSTGDELSVVDLGVPYFENARYWPFAGHDAGQSHFYQQAPGNLAGSFSTPNRYGVNTLNTTFESYYLAASTSAVYYLWDFNGDDLIDDEGYNKDSVSHNYTSPGIYTVKLTFSNDVGEAFSVVRQDYIIVYPDVIADFDVTPTNNIDAPVRVYCTDQSQNGVRFRNWEYDEPGGGTSWNIFSMEQNTYLDLTLDGAYTIRLTVSNHFETGGSSSDSITKSVVVDSVIPNATNHYVWKGGRHIYPFKNWEDAANNIHEAVSAAGPGEHVIVTNGLYVDIVRSSPAADVHVRSVNGPYVTIIDCDKQPGGFRFLDGGVLDGFTIQNRYGSEAPVNMEYGKARNLILKNNVSHGLMSKVAGGIHLVSAVLENSLIESNYSSLAGGVYSAGSLVRNCIIRANESLYGSGLYSADGQTDNCLITRNKGSYAAVLFNGGGRMLNTTVTDNDIDQSEESGGALYFKTGVGRVTELINTISYGNNGPNQKIEVPGQTTRVLVKNSCYTPEMDSLAADQIQDSIISDPLFIDSANGNYRLSGSSPCVDAGNNLYTYTTPIKTVRVDFGDPSLSTPGNWNNITNIASGTQIPDMVDAAGANTGYQLELLESFGAIHTTGVDSSALYPSTAQRDGMMTTNSASLTYYPYIEISGLNTSNIYDFTFFGSMADGPGSEVSGFKIDGESARLSYTENTTNVVVLSGISAPSGTLTIEIQRSAWPGGGLIGVLEIDEFDPNSGETVFTNRLDLDGSPRIYNTTIDVGAYELNTNVPPQVSISANPVESPAPAAIMFTATVSDVDGTITDIEWNFGDGSVSNGASLTSVSHVYANPNHYKATVTATDNEGWTASDSIGIHAGDPVPATPANFTAVNQSPTNNWLAWQDMASNETSYVIRSRVFTNYTETIVDQEEALFDYLPNWTLLTDASAYGGTYREITPVDWFADADYRPALPAPGNYEIYVWYPVVPNASKIVRYSVYHETGTESVIIDQSANGGQWVLLGNWQLSASSHVLLFNYYLRDPVLADAIKFVPMENYETVASIPADSTNYSHAITVVDAYFEYMLAASNAYGYSDWVTADVMVPPTNKLPMANIISASPTSGVPALLVSVSGEGSDMDGTVINYVWDFGDIYSGSVQSGADLTNTTYAYKYDGTYTVSFTVYDDQGYASTNTAEVDVVVQGTVPNAPINLWTEPNWSPSVDIYWTDKAYNEDQFVIQRKQEAGAFSTIATIDSPASRYSDESASPGVLYTYRVAADNSYGLSDWSNEAAARIPLLPEAHILAPTAATSVVTETEITFLGYAIVGDNAITNLQWNFGDESILTNGGFELTNVVYSYTIEGIYTAVFTVADSDGFGAEDSVEIEVIPEGGIFWILNFGFLILGRKK